MKIFYSIHEMFPSLNKVQTNLINDISFYIFNQMIINNKDNPLKISKLLDLLSLHLNNNKKIEYLFIFNHNSLIINEENENNNNIKLNISNIRDFMYISVESGNNEDIN